MEGSTRILRGRIIDFVVVSPQGMFWTVIQLSYHFYGRNTAIHHLLRIGKCAKGVHEQIICSQSTFGNNYDLVVAELPHPNVGRYSALQSWHQCLVSGERIKKRLRITLIVEFTSICMALYPDRCQIHATIEQWLRGFDSDPALSLCLSVFPNILL